MPSRAEGFGLPILDAFACGVPVLTSRRSSMPEVAGEAAVYCDPDEPADIAAGIVRLLEPATARALAAAGRARLECFSWQRTAAAMCAVYECCGPARAAVRRGKTEREPVMAGEVGRY
jgi:glycosyltransferase involved in cell wall biosynthesis